MKPFPVNFRRLSWMIWISFIAIWTFIELMPESNRLTRSAGITIFAFVLLGFIALCWRKQVIRYPMLVITGLAILFIILPGRPHDSASLRAAYVRGLHRYEGVTYVWGGESFKGVDCSGLIRRGLIDACFLEGLQTMNPRLVRMAFYIWWHDSSAKSLGTEYLQATRHLFKSKSINSTDLTKLLPGDLAVTSDGVHVLAYLGGNGWTQADPGEAKVIRNVVPSKNGWFSSSVNLTRWRVLEPESKN